MKKKNKIYIGTSGWHYKHWSGTFYPEEVKEKDQLAYYIRFFKTVELNNSFYRLPSPKTFSKWGKSVPDDFIFSVKASRYITHMKKLKDGNETLSAFLKNVRYLKNKTGPILFQLPPGWKINTDRLENFLTQLPSHYRYVFEFRNHTWYDDRVYELLRQYNCAFCIYQLDKHLSPIKVTSDFVYIRLHGPGAKYQGKYTDKILETWAVQCKSWISEQKDVFIYFDNDQHGYAAMNALTLSKLLHHI